MAGSRSTYEIGLHHSPIHTSNEEYYGLRKAATKVLLGRAMPLASSWRMRWRSRGKNKTRALSTALRLAGIKHTVKLVKRR